MIGLVPRRRHLRRQICGESAWERHPNCAEIVQIIDGATTLRIMTGASRNPSPSRRGWWWSYRRARHHFESPDGVSVITATPQPTEHLTVAVDDPRTLE